MSRVQQLPRPRTRAPHRPGGTPVQMLAQLTMERRRLEQERSNWESRMARIDARLKEIAAVETRLIPAIQPVTTAAPAGPPMQRAPRRNDLPPGVTEFTMKY